MHASDIGFVALVVAIVAAAYAAFAAPIGLRQNNPATLASARNAVYVVTGTMLTAIGVLAYLLVSHDFGVLYVVGNSSIAQPWYFDLAGLYGGQAGSLLVWATGLAIFSGLAVYVNRDRLHQVMPWAIGAMMTVQVFFLVVLVFLSNPFERLPIPLTDGQGVNALLRDPGFLIHPPFLLFGYMAWTMPFALAIGAMISRRTDSQWLRAARPWLLSAWLIHSIGLMLGAWWAYHVLGWGGFWNWDPVENVAFLPWLTGTAFMHSIMVEERRGLLRRWNMLLILATFLLCIFGTLVVRGGLLDSVHNFATSALGPSFLAFLGFSLAVSLFLFFTRAQDIDSGRRFDSAVSKESGFLLNNLLFVGIAFATFWGTVFPLLTEVYNGSKITVGAPFYEKVNGPLFLALLVLMGVGPLLAWRRTTWDVIKRNFRPPLIGAALWLVFLIAALGVTNPWSLAGLTAVAFVFGVIALEYYRGVRARRASSGEAVPAALTSMVTRNRRRYGGYIVHAGVLLVALGVIGAELHQQDLDVTLRTGEVAVIGDYQLRYDGITERRGVDNDVTEATLTVFKDGEFWDEVHPRRVVYDGQESQPTSQIAIRTTMKEDLYVLLAAWDSQAATFLMFVNPLVMWLWVGGVVFLIGTAVALWPAPASASRPTGPSPAELEEARR